MTPVPPRRADWREALVAYLVDAGATPLEYGRHDCALFAAGAVAAMTGADPAHAWRGRYRSIAQGRRLLRQSGLKDHLAAAGAIFEEIAPAGARPGDLAAVATDDGPALGIVQGECIYLVGPGGLRLVALTDAARAWRVP